MSTDSDVIAWNLQLTVRNGRLDELRRLMPEMVASTREEQGTLHYEWFLSADEQNCHIYERYTDSAAAMIHLAAFGAKFAERFLSCVEPTHLFVYGGPSEVLRTALRGFGAVHFAPLGGFCR